MFSLPTAFYFRVVFANYLFVSDTSFQEVSGISSELETEEVIEGGENRYVQRLPKGVKHPLLEMKRGMSSIASPLVNWCRLAMEGDFVEPFPAISICVYLMDSHQLPIRAWMFADAFPVKWEIDGFGSTKNEVAIEKMSFSYTYSHRLI